MSTLRYRSGEIALALSLLLCFLTTARELRHPSQYLALAQQIDFGVYYVAAELVHEGQDFHMYDDAGTGEDPQTRFATPQSVFAMTARDHGVAETHLYVYPPFLADALVPLTFLDLTTASLVWRLLCLVSLVLTAGCASRLLGFRVFSAGSVLLLVGLLSLRPVWVGLFFGQVTVILLFLWTLGTLLYVTGRKRSSAWVIAIAVLIKLTPLILIVPMLIWRDWRWLRWFAGGLVGLLALVCLKNGVQTPVFFWLHVMPSMSVGKPDLDNKTLLSLVQVAWHRSEDFRGVVIPHGVVLGGKLLSAAVLLYATVRTALLGRQLPNRGRMVVIASFSLLSICIAPVSWQHAYAISFLLLAVMWKQAFDLEVSLSSLLLLAVTSISIGSISFTAVGRAAGPPYVLAYLAPLCGIALSMHSLGLNSAPLPEAKALASELAHGEAQLFS